MPANLYFAEQQLDYIERLAAAIAAGRNPETYGRAIRNRAPIVTRGIVDLRAFANCKPETRVAVICQHKADALEARLNACLAL